MGIQRIYDQLKMRLEKSQELQYAPDNIDKLEDLINPTIVQLRILSDLDSEFDLDMEIEELEYSIDKFLDDCRGCDQNEQGQAEAEFNLAKKEISGYLPDILKKIESDYFS